MNTNSSIENRVEQLLSAYGDGSDGACPSREQWRLLLERPEGAPVTLINFFKLRDRAHYPQGLDGVVDSGTGQDAFGRYAAVSSPTLEKVGGRFTFFAPFEGVLVGKREDWDLIVLGAYPNSAAVLALFEEPVYQAAFRHRIAACERQKVIIGSS